MIKISKESLLLLKKCLKKFRPDLFTELEMYGISFINKNNFNEVAVTVSDELLLNGLDNKDEPTKYGLELEDLIDDIIREFT